MNLKKKFVIGAASLALVAGMGGIPAMGAPIPLVGGGSYDPATHRVAGADRVATSIAAAKARATNVGTALNAVTNLYLVGHSAQVDAATAGQIEDANGVVVYAPSDTSADSMKLLALKVKDVFPGITTVKAIGGTGVISDQALADFKAGYGAGLTTTGRIGGKDRYATAVALAKDTTFSGATANTKVYLANGVNFVDALGAGAVEAGAALLLINPTGDINPALQKYYDSLNIPTPVASNVIVLGGEGAVPTAQVDKLMGVSSATVPSKGWEAAAMKADAIKNIQKTAILYKGQKAWEDGDGDGTYNEGLDDDFSPNGAASAVTPTGEDPALVNDEAIKGSMKAADSAKAFMGYKPAVDSFTTLNDYVAKNVKMGKLAIENTIVADAGASDVTALDGATEGAVATSADKILVAFKQLYGFSAKVNASKERASFPYFTFKDATPATPDDESDDIITGIDFAKADAVADKGDKVACLTAGGATCTDGAGKTQTTTPAQNNATLKQLAKDTETQTPTALASTVPTAKTDNAINYVALAPLVAANLKAAEDLAAKAKADYTSAVKTYQAIENAINGIKTGTFTRVQGANRYETNAALNWYLYFSDPAFRNMVVGNPLAYVASGDDAHLADSVVGGQVTGIKAGANPQYGGPIFLVPSTGTVNSDVTAVMAALGKRAADKVEPNNVWAIGGTGAVADNVLSTVALATVGQ